MQLYRARPGSHWYRPVTSRLAPDMSAALGLVGGAALAGALAGVGELRPGWFALGAYAALCGVLGAVSRPAAAPLIAGAGWLFFDGFVVHRYAQLGWAGLGTELARFAFLAAAALVGSLPAALPRRRVRVEHLV
ncbi:hypothetical protein ACFC1R_01315 [Kitasatospora sp. NPDC056138]|uniref:hypothetical protein n=1 Tax=Kitasatospora sp. NPDC056138 TaxID=3345724 RepID=UPI0035DE49BA